ncbi:hypothetical protein [Frigoribacterium faeni]|uniref:hypothetical protein n=1 Tax=Frigoribacterium faeni TaxID=145483 RepID=UPI00141A7227|nr:hypothetical protein [Frigoribacterium faeni]NIJ06158.1 hypothetical protein [Frigoribacterium faeni]
MTPTPQPDAATDRSPRRAAVFLRSLPAAVRGLRTPVGRARLLAAATALGVVLVARFALGLVAMAGAALGYSVTPWPSDFTATPVGQFLGSFVLYPFPFYVVAFVVLLLVRPVDPDLPLAPVLRRGVVAGASGTVALAVVGIVPGVAASLSGGTWVNLALYLTTIPLSAGIVDTALLLVGVVVAWHAARSAPGVAEVAAGADAAADHAAPGDEAAGPAPIADPDEEAAADPRGQVADPAREPAPVERTSALDASPEATAPLPAVLPVAPTTRPAPPRGDSAADDWSRFAPPAADDGRDR